VETNNALGKTLGGLKLAAGAANAVQEFDIRVWLETWATHALAQIVRLEQYYEADKTVLGLAGAKAQLFEKYGINQIDDALLEEEITVRVSVGLGAGDPMQRLAKFVQATNAIAPFLAQTKEFQSGQVELNWEAFVEEAYGAVGYKDGGSRFFKKNDQPQQNPMADLNMGKLKSEIEKNERMGKAAIMTGLSNVAKVALGKKELESDFVDRLLGHQLAAKQLGADHGHRHNELHLSALDHGHRHGLAIAAHRQGIADAALDRANEAAQGADDGGDTGSGGAAQTPASPPSAGPQGQPSASPPPAAAPSGPSNVTFTHDANGRIVGAQVAHGGGGSAGDDRMARLEAQFADLHKKHTDLHQAHMALQQRHAEATRPRA
jgi:hypothetical protein